MPSRMLTVPVLGGLFLMVVIAGAAALTAPEPEFAGPMTSATEPIGNECADNAAIAPSSVADEAPPNVNGFIDCLRVSGHGKIES